MNNVLVFKTSIESEQKAEQVRPLLDRLIHKGEKWNFDLEDCDRILRVESARLKPQTIMTELTRLGLYCEELAD